MEDQTDRATHTTNPPETQRPAGNPPRDHPRRRHGPLGLLQQERLDNLQLAVSRTTTQLAEYIIIHEAVHLTHFHHQKGFHHKLEQIIPDHHKHEQQLQQYLATPTDIENKADPLNTKPDTKQPNKNPK
jgi:hypothetical protein